MNTWARYSALLLAGIILLGCTAASKEIRLKSRSERKDVFSESAKEPISSDMAELRIRASIKTKFERQFLPGWSKGIPLPHYSFLINIDGQAVIWRIDGERESHGKTHPENGEGLRYILEREIRLKSGPHNVFCGLPEEDYFVQFEATLKGGEVHILEFEPVYGECLTRHQSFRHGIGELRIYMDGNSLRTS